MMTSCAQPVLVMQVASPDQVDYAWLAPHVCDNLLSVDQMLRQQLHIDDIPHIAACLDDIIKVLDVIGECALQTAIVKMRAALLMHVAPAPWMAIGKSWPVRYFLYATIAYLEHVRAGTTTSVLTLYPYYREMMLALNMQSVHPEELYYAQSRQSACLVEHDVLQEMVPFQATHYDLVKRQFEIEFHLYMQVFGVANKEDAHILAMHRLLGMIVAAQTSVTGRAFWGVVLGFSEAMVLSAIRNDGDVRKLYIMIADHVRISSPEKTVAAPAIVSQALFFIAHVEASPDSVLEKIKPLYQMPAVKAQDYKQSWYMRIDPVVLRYLKSRMTQLHELWRGVVNGSSHDDTLFIKAIENLKGQGELLGSKEVTELFNVLRRHIVPIVRNKSAYSVKLEVTRNLLFVEAVLCNIYHLPDTIVNIIQMSSDRLASSLSRKYVDVQLACLQDMTANEHYHKTIMLLADEMLSQLEQLELLLQQLLIAPGDRDCLRHATELLGKLDSILLMLNHREASLALGHAKKIMLSMCNDVFDRKVLWCVMNNMGVLSFFARAMRHRFYLEKEGVHFDRQTGMLMRRAPPGSNDTWLPHPEKFDQHCAALLQHQHIAGQIVLEDEEDELEKQPWMREGLLDSFLPDMTALVDDLDSILPLSKLAPMDMGHVDTLHRVFHALEHQSRMACVTPLSHATRDIAHALNKVLAESNAVPEHLYTLLDYAVSSMDDWLEEMRLQGQSAIDFTLLAAEVRHYIVEEMRCDNDMH